MGKKFLRGFGGGGKEYADGKLTTAEVLGDTETAVTRIGYTV